MADNRKRPRGRTNVAPTPDPEMQKGRQQGHQTGKDAWKSNLKQNERQPGERRHMKSTTVRRKSRDHGE